MLYVHVVEASRKRPKQPWVARITGVDRRFGLAREFLKPLHDYACAVGVRVHFLLWDGNVYELSRPRPRSMYDDRTYGRVSNGALEPLTLEEVIAWAQTL